MLQVAEAYTCQTYLEVPSVSHTNRFSVKSLFVCIAAAVNKIANVGNYKTVFAEKPLIYFHLAFIANLQIRI